MTMIEPPATTGPGGDGGSDQPGVVATVLESAGGVWRVLDDRGMVREVTLRGRLKIHEERRAEFRKLEDDGRLEESDELARPRRLAVGDRVRIEEEERGHSWTIAEILPRRSRIARRQPGGRWGERVMVANVDQLVVVFAAASPEPNERMIDRFLVIAEANSVPARLVLNKVDLVYETALRERFQAYERIGYPVHFTSVESGLGLNELRRALAGRTSALAGPSGAGKSSLINALFGVGLRVGDVSSAVNKGRHTTVGALLTPIPDGGFVVDTPGLREVGLWGLPARELQHEFPEFRPHLGNCRFADCTHLVEPGCAVREAVDQGSIAAGRMESYGLLHAELEGESRR